MRKFLFPYELIEKDSDILIFGAGDVGRQYLQAIKKTNYCNVKCVLDNSYKKLSNAKLPLGVNIASPEFILQCENYSAILIATASSDLADKFRLQLLSLGVENSKIIFANDNVTMELSEDDGTETLRIAVMCLGGMGDDIVSALLLKGIRDVTPKNLVLDYYCKSYQLFENLEFIDKVCHISQFAGNDEYDIVMVGSNFYGIEKLALSKAKRFSEKLYLYFVDVLDVCKNILNCEDLTASSRLIRLCEILGKNRLEQSNIHGILPFDRNTKLQLKLDINMENYIERLGLKNRQFITLCESASPAYNRDTRLWHPQNFLALCDLINKDFPDKTIVWIGNKTVDIPGNKKIIDMRDNTSLAELSALLKCAKLHIGLDTGPTHLRHFLEGGTSVCLFGSTSTYAYEENINIRSSKYPCSKNGCEWVSKKWLGGNCLISPNANYAMCMEAISPQEVYKHIYGYLTAQNPEYIFEKISGYLEKCSINVNKESQMMTPTPINIETFSFVRTVPFFNINVLKPHIYGDGVIVYGAGNNCVRFMTSLYLQNIKANILCVADANKSKHGKSILGLPIIAVEELQKYNKQTPILITPAKGFRQIADNLKSMQFSNLFIYDNMARKYLMLRDKYLQKDNQGKNYFNFNGALLPDVNDGDLGSFMGVFNDVFYIPLFHSDNYDKSIVDILDLYMIEGPYGYTDGNFDVSVKNGDVVIDAGAWIGDFSAYSANKGAEVYAFEPTKDTFALLEQTAELNKSNKIFPVDKGLSDKTGNAFIKTRKEHSAGNTIIAEFRDNSKLEQISLTTLDAFVAENNIKKVDFIKADIEGSERDMLRGATNVLKAFAPKLAICTYHLPDDPRVLEDIILEANPKYKVVHLRMKLFACVEQ